MNLLQNSLTMTLALLLSNTFSIAQYGNEWINYNQEYYKIEIGSEGIYRIDYNTLQTAGIPTASINPQHFQMYHNGTEQHIYVSGESDNSFDPGDYIEFHGTFNDGSLDTPLYPNPNDQPHTFTSMYTDSAVYWLTWTSASPGKRMQSYYDGNYAGKTADPYIWYRENVYFLNQYFDGIPFFSPGYFSEFTAGEGWFSGDFSGQSVRRITVNMPNLYTSGPKPFYEFSVHAKSDPQDLDANGFNHELTMKIGTTILYQQKYRGYKITIHKDSLDLALASSSTRFDFQSTYMDRGRHVVSYMKVDYPRLLNISNKGVFRWNYTGNNTYFEFINYGSAYLSPIIYDLTNKRRIKGDVGSNSLKFNTPDAGKKSMYIIDEALTSSISAANITKVEFTEVDPLLTDFNYLIITHPSLKNAAEEYKAYRESAQGGSFRVHIAYTSELYNHYYYGVHHPMAIRNFCKMLYDNQANKPEYLLLLGKGQVNFMITKDPLRRHHEDLVPTWGVPPSDYMFVTDYTKNDLKPAIAVGRVPARKNEEVLNYLEKVKLHEQYGNKSKIQLQLTGGSGQSEADLLAQHQDSFYSIASGEKAGLGRVQFRKDQSVIITESLVDEIQGVINDGVHTVSYFGHGASEVLEVDMGDPARLNNMGNYPLFVFNGCALGHSFTESSLPEKFLLQKDDGCVSWVASSAYGYINELYSWSSIFYTKLYDEMYGESIGHIIQATIEEFQKPINNFNRAQCRQMLYHGDPAIKLYAPDKPDYEVVNPISIHPHEVNAEHDSFALVLNIANHGLALKTDTPNIHVRIQYSNDSIEEFGPRTYRRVMYKETIYFWIPMSKYSAGLNKFTITVDHGDSIAEITPLGEFNNTRYFEFFMPSNSLYTLFPPLHSIINTPEVKLVVQNYNLLAGEQEFIFEIDTTPEFNSPLLQNSGVVSGNLIGSHTFYLPPLDSTDFFWRARFNKPLDQGGVWETSTFAFIYNSPKGWSQAYYTKYAESELINMNVDTSRNLSFNKTISNKYGLYAAGKNLGPTYRGIRVEPNYYYPGFLQHGLGMIAVNPNTQERWMDSSKFNKFVPNDNWGINKKYFYPKTRSGAYWFDMRNQEDRDSFVHYMNNVPDGYFLFLFAGGNSANELWEDTVFSVFEYFGASEIRTVQNGHPYALMGKKGWAVGTATEVTANYNSVIPPESQFVQFATPIYPLSDHGSMISQPVGPAKSWALFYRNVEPGETNEDSLNYDIIGIRADGQTDTLFRKIDSAQKVLTGIDAASYPFLKIKANFKDKGSFTPMQQYRWTILYEGVPEGTINPLIVYNLNNDTIQEGDSLRLKLAFENISEYHMDSVLVYAYNLDYFGNTDTIDFSYHEALNAGEYLVLDYAVPTLGNPNMNSFNISINHQMAQWEQTLANNVFNLRYHVLRDERNPLLDVVFDGIHILDKDIVSPSPIITMTVLDENNFIFITDPASFTVTLTHPDGSLEEISSLNDDVTFIPASKAGEKAVLEYHPKDLESGYYKLSVSVKDASGNESSDLDYEINFRVIRESTVSNFYPYPNPFTTSMRFVYTLTGDQLPDYVKITIMTVSGKVVREITQNELGAMRIGNNISDFAWDGTDEYGDPLANGVYIYKVTVRINGEDLDLYSTTGDNMFVDGYGKIYLMR